MAQNRLQSDHCREPVTVTWRHRAEVLRYHQYHMQAIVHEPNVVACMGILQGTEIIGSVIFQRYRWPDIEVGIFTTSKSWCTRQTLNQIFSYPFQTLNCRRVTAITDSSTPEVCNFIKRLGFVEEGRLRQALPHSDSIILGMLKAECRWIKHERNG